MASAAGATLPERPRRFGAVRYRGRVTFAHVWAFGFHVDLDLTSGERHVVFGRRPFSVVVNW